MITEGEYFVVVVDIAYPQIIKLMAKTLERILNNRGRKMTAQLTEERFGHNSGSSAWQGEANGCSVEK